MEAVNKHWLIRDSETHLFSNSFSLTFVLRLNMPTSCITNGNHNFLSCVKNDRNFMIYFKIDITISMCRTCIFSGDMTKMSSFNIIIDIVIITNPTFSRVLKVFISFFSHHKFFVKMFFFITNSQYLLSSTILLIKL